MAVPLHPFGHSDQAGSLGWRRKRHCSLRRLHRRAIIRTSDYLYTKEVMTMSTDALDYSDFIEIAEGTYWVGYADKKAGLHCNPYLIADGDEAVLIDSGSRNEFSTVMLKIMRTGTNLNSINRLIYQHYDPDLCGNIPHVEATLENDDLQIISHYENNIFINYYGAKSPMRCIEKLDFHYDFASGRHLQFILTPYAHSPGSFMTYDTKTKVLFSSDIFGSYDNSWDLYARMFEKCTDCIPQDVCPITNKRCQLYGILDFHKRIMTSGKALMYALDKIKDLEVNLIAPQHGSILQTSFTRELVIQKLKSLGPVGIDRLLGGAS